MSDPLATLRKVTWAVHALAGVAAALLLINAGVIAGMCLVVGALIGAASSSAVPKRPRSLYVMFGAIMGYVFWLCISLLRRGDVLGLVPATLVVAGASWMLRSPSWASAIFTWAATAAALGLVAMWYQARFDVPDADPVLIAQGALTAAVLLGIGVVESAFGLAEVFLIRARKRAKAERDPRPASGPPRR